jgi:poly-gamma-glutamate synthesis protein (capsule biosynthesis protein)
MSLLFTGDVLTHRAVNRAALQPDGTFDYSSMFAPIASLVSAADVAICHLESPLAPDGEIIVAPPRVSASPSLAPSLAGAGFDRCSTASNHSMDRGTAGIDSTIAGLESSGIDQAGMARSAEEAIVPIVETNSIRWAHLSYTFSFNGLTTPPGEPWRSNLIDPQQIIADATDVRARGAEAVIVSLHWGLERVVEPTAEQRQVAATVAPPTSTATWCDAGNGNVIYPVSLADDPTIDAALRLQLVASRQRTAEVIGEYLIDP